MQFLSAAGLPPGVVNIVFGVGPQAGEAIVKHPNVPIVSFTGSTAIGKRIQEVSAPFVKRLSLEVNLPVDSTIENSVRVWSHFSIDSVHSKCSKHKP